MVSRQSHFSGMILADKNVNRRKCFVNNCKNITSVLNLYTWLVYTVGYRRSNVLAIVIKMLCYARRLYVILSVLKIILISALRVAAEFLPSRLLAVATRSGIDHPYVRRADIRPTLIFFFQILWTFQ